MTRSWAAQGSEPDRRAPLAPVAPHHPRLARDAGARTRGRCSELEGDVEDTPALGHDFLADPVIGIAAIRCFMRAPLSASSCASS